MKIDKTITMGLKSITNNYNQNTIEANSHIQKMGNTFLNAQQMSAQLITNMRSIVYFTIPCI
jgi:hypothetical protein